MTFSPFKIPMIFPHYMTNFIPQLKSPTENTNNSINSTFP